MNTPYTTWREALGGEDGAKATAIVNNVQLWIEWHSYQPAKEGAFLLWYEQRTMDLLLATQDGKYLSGIHHVLDASSEEEVQLMLSDEIDSLYGIAEDAPIWQRVPAKEMQV